MMSIAYQIGMLGDGELQQALDLVWRVFLQFEAPEYSVEGVLEFQRFIETEAIRKRIKYEGFLIWGAYEGEKITGVIAAREPSHISLLFVDPLYQRRGIAKALFNTLLEYYQDKCSRQEITVNSSPYAVEVYRRLGFTDNDCEQTVNGIRFVPMKRKLNY